MQSKSGGALHAGVGVARQQRLYREKIPQYIIDDAIVVTSRKSLPFTAVPCMLDHTARVLNAIAGKELDDINIVSIREASKPAANILLRLKAVTKQENTRGGSRNICRQSRSYAHHGQVNHSGQTQQRIEGEILEAMSVPLFEL